MYFSLAAQLFEDIANIILVSTLSALGDGFMFAATGRHTLSSTAFRYGTYVACLGLLSLAIACFATSLTDRSVNQWALTIYNIEFPYAWYISDIVEVVASKTELEHARTTQMAAVFNILYWVASILQLGQASVVMHKAMKTESLRKASLPIDNTVLYLTASF
ncbi:hypothetical protein O9K51_08461 [Purpureocillium lavendulum]|uniref:Uncharacterized protein n=1 Tax=Purpureocillium lavendulum TaxID=1247861 RepID=A0AB34FJE0_9HYPO|nr:hypothetical protein O9K51_08461 [Purpureocillium lavendulum]